ncbi:DNA repair protein RecN [Weeksellaceae bacterium TAE3-ERU29]|nr:DNA repair protein RecN [Weeksellaceae bacterium TAE3-ERU29]
MLKQLNIKNYALIDELQLKLDKGLSIITGETGAGKSILLGALRLVLGERADLKAVKNSDEKCVIEAVFDITDLDIQNFFEENDLDYEDETILRREILPSGKSRSFVNDVPTTLKVMETLSDLLIDVHSQFQTANIISEDFQFEWVDSVAKNKDLIDSFRQELKELNRLKKELKTLENQQLDFAKEKEYNEFIFKELSEANLDDVNLESLEKELYLLENSEGTLQSLNNAFQIIDSEQGILSLFTELQIQAKSFSEFLSSDELKERIDSVKIEMQDILNEIDSKSQEIELDPERLLEVQQKINLLNTLLQKHHFAEVSELIALRNDLDEKLNDEFSIDSKIEKLKKEIKTLTDNLNNQSDKIHENRKSVIPKIKNEVLTTLQQLGMENSEINIELIKREEFNNYGKEDLSLLFTANKGTKLNTLEKSVSGGERSRLMLAVKKSLAFHKALPTLILDEIDTGVSGKIAGEMAKIMQEMSDKLQVITITHLPQVAAKGDVHFKVIKTEKNNSTVSEIKKLNTEERLQEIAQMISGSEITNAALQQAQELLG